MRKSDIILLLPSFMIPVETRETSSLFLKDDTLATITSLNSPIGGAGLLMEEFGPKELAEISVKSHGYPEELIPQKADEIGKILERGGSTLFLCSVEGEVIGWLNLRSLSSLMPRLRFGRFFGIYGVDNIVVRPGFRKREVAKIMYHKAVELLHPRIIIGQTKNPAAVRGRAKALEELYRTFFGDSEVTPSSPRPHHREPVISMLMKACMRLRGMKRGGEDLILVSPDVLLPTIPDVSKFHDSIKGPFQSLIRAQEICGEKETVAKLLLSVRRELLSPYW